MYRQGNTYYVDFKEQKEKNRRSDDLVRFYEGIAIGIVAAAIGGYTTLFTLSVSAGNGYHSGLEKAVLKLYVKRDKNAVDFSS